MRYYGFNACGLGINTREARLMPRHRKNNIHKINTEVSTAIATYECDFDLNAACRHHNELLLVRSLPAHRGHLKRAKNPPRGRQTFPHGERRTLLRRRRRRGAEMRVTYPAHLHQLGDHDDAEAIFLPHHPPKVVQRLLLGSWSGEGRDNRGTKAAASNAAFSGAVVKPCIIAT